MKLLHSKTISDPIILLSACPNMYLIAVVTTRQLTIFRSTTMAPVFSHLLGVTDTDVLLPKTGSNSESVASVALASRLSSCWSPTGRLFALSLPNGAIRVYDVETTELVRRLVPQSYDAEHEAKDGGVSGAESDEEEEEEEEVGATLQKKMLQKLYAVQYPIRLSTECCPVISMSWTRVISPYAPSLFHHQAGQEICLSLHPGLMSTVWMDELCQPCLASAVKPHESCSAAHISNALRTEEGEWTGGSGDRQMYYVSLLVVLSAQGKMSVVLGGLHEVYACQWSFPTNLPLSFPMAEGTRAGFDKLRVRQMVLAAVPSFSYSASYKGQEEEQRCGVTAFREAHPSPRKNLFLNTHALLAALDARDPTVANEEHTAKGTTQTAYSLFLVVQPEISSAGRVSFSTHEHILELPLNETLSYLVSPEMVAQCWMKELHRIAHTCFEFTRKKYFECYGDLLHVLGLPEAAGSLKYQLLDMGNPDELAEYFDALLFSSSAEDERAYGGIDRIASAELLYGKACQFILRYTSPVCCRCYDSAVAIAKAHQDIAAMTGRGTGGGSDMSSLWRMGNRTPLSTLLKLSEEHPLSGAASTASPPPSPSLLLLFHSLRRRCEGFVRHVQQELAQLTEVLQWLVFMANAEPVMLRVLEFRQLREAASGRPPPPTPQRVVTQPLPSDREPVVFQWLQRAEKAWEIAQKPQQQKPDGSWRCNFAALAHHPTPWGISWELDTLRVLSEETSPTTLFIGFAASMHGLSPPVQTTPLSKWEIRSAASEEVPRSILPAEPLEVALERKFTADRTAAFYGPSTAVARLHAAPSRLVGQHTGCFQGSLLWECLTPAEILEAQEAAAEDEMNEEEESVEPCAAPHRSTVLFRALVSQSGSVKPSGLHLFLCEGPPRMEGEMRPVESGGALSAEKAVHLEEDGELEPALDTAHVRAFALLARDQYLLALTAPSGDSSLLVPSGSNGVVLQLAVIRGDGRLQRVSSPLEDDEAEREEVEPGSHELHGDTLVLSRTNRSLQKPELKEEAVDDEDDKDVPAVLQMLVDASFVSTPLLISVSREKEFTVMACGRKFLVVDLYD